MCFINLSSTTRNINTNKTYNKFRLKYCLELTKLVYTKQSPPLNSH